jgi:hypothetical protein
MICQLAETEIISPRLANRARLDLVRVIAIRLHIGILGRGQIGPAVIAVLGGECREVGEPASAPGRLGFFGGQPVGAPLPAPNVLDDLPGLERLAIHHRLGQGGDKSLYDAVEIPINSSICA